MPGRAPRPLKKRQKTVCTCTQSTHRVYAEPTFCRTNTGHPLVRKTSPGTSLAVQWLRLHALKAGGPGFNPWSGNWTPRAATKIMHVTLHLCATKINNLKKKRSPNSYKFLLLFPFLDHFSSKIKKGWLVADSLGSDSIRLVMSPCQGHLSISGH